MDKVKALLNKIAKIGRVITLIFGIIFSCMIVLSFTEYPYWAYYNLGISNSALNKKPDCIMIFGAGGMPDPETLIRLYYGAEAAKLYPKAKIVVAMPVDSIEDENNALLRMTEELHLHKVKKRRILHEYKGRNTYQQAKNVYEMLQPDTAFALMVITSPEHMYRAVGTFRKLGLKHVGGMPSFESATAEHLLLDENELIPDKDKTLSIVDLRYNFWNYMKYQIIVAREYCAITYYKSRGWI